MSEFKYACPVCGQHIKCDSSQAGTVMECPTCFQKITVPQAPSEQQKLLLTGTKVGMRRVAASPSEDKNPPVRVKKYSGPLVVVCIFLFIGAAVAFVYHGTIFKPENHAPAPSPAPKHETKHQDDEDDDVSAVVASQAVTNIAGWTLNLDGAVIPDSPASGKINGQDFATGRATYSTNGILTIRAGMRGQTTLGLTIDFRGASPESLSRKTINVMTNAVLAARVTLRWQENGGNQRANFDRGYAMRLQFGELDDDRMTGKIYLCTPDETKSYVAGMFNVEVRRARPTNRY